MKNTWKIAVSASLVAVALAATAMPTKRQLAEAQKLVNDLTADDIRALNAKQKTAGEVAAAHLALLDKAETEAGRYLLLQGAFRLYVRGGDYDAAADVLQRIKADISDVTPEVMVTLVDGEMRNVAYSKAPKVHAIYNDARRTIKYRKRLTAAEAEAEKRGTSKSFKQLAECHVQLGNWKKALDTFAQARIPAAKWELDPDSVSDFDALKAAEYWWSYEVEEPEPFRAHAAALYRIALDGGLVTGLRREVIEKRIKEVGAAGRTVASLVLGGSKLYCVIDLSAGPNATNYPVSYLATEPKGGWTDEYKTTKLVLRRIEPGTFIMGEDQTNESHRVTLTKPFYIGIFEVTQKQYELVMGNNPSKCNGKMRPVEYVTYDMIRGAAQGARWPSSSAVDKDSFLGRFRGRTRIDTFDLPTEAQWEYACRSGTKSAYNNGGDTEGDLKQLARYGKKYRHTTVGSYRANASGLYDMHGNVSEWCLDWSGPLSFGTDPVGLASGSLRVRRGGSWRNDARNCRSAKRSSYHPSKGYTDYGFRLALTLSDK